MNDTWNRTGRVAAIVAWSLFALLAWAAVSHAQTDPAADPNAAVADSTPPPVKIIPPRAGWLSDRMPLRPGDLVTVVVDEQTAARERVSRVADGNRNSTNAINAALGSGAPMNYNIRTGILSNSRDVGEAGRTGDLTAVLTVTVLSVEPGGALRIKGARSVTVDGRPQTISLEGLVRAEDVDGSNRVLSSRIADAVIAYKGGTIGPRKGIMGKILGMLWP